MSKKNIIIICAASVLAAGLLVFLGLRKNPGSLPVAAAPGSSSASFLSQARELEAKGDLQGAKALYQKAVSDFSNSPEVMNWQKKIEELNIKLIFSSTLTPKSTFYEVKPGDTLTKIAKVFLTTTDLIKKSNNLSSDMLVPGRKLKVWTSPFTILVDKSSNILILKSDEEVIKTYVVSTGKDNSSPVGTFKIVNKLVNPTWFKAGAVVPAGSTENILGTRWMGINVPGYGIHGTTEPQFLGKQVTQGCVRMANPDVEELYTIIPVGTEVTITD